MAKVKFLGAEARNVPALGGRIAKGQIVDVDDPEAVYGLTQQVDLWSPHDEAAQEAHAAGEAARDERLAAEATLRAGVIPADDDPADDDPEGTE